MSAAMTTHAFALTPLDLLFFRDGRPFEAAAQVRSGLPQPQTVAGAVRSWLLARAAFDFPALAENIKRGASFGEACAAQGEKIAAIGYLRFRGPWFSLDGKSPLLPAPATLRRKKHGDDTHFVRLDPLQKPLPGWRSEHGLQPLWYRGNDRLEAVAGYLTLDGMAEFLRGDVPPPEALVTAGALYAEDRRSSVAISPQHLTALEGQIFSVGFLALRPNVSLLLEVAAPAGMSFPEQGIIRLGGEARQVHLRALPNSIAWPRPTPREGRKLFILTTPAVFADGWKPSALSPRAAAVPAPTPVSGWDMARGGPKPTRFAVQAGAVYFVNDTTAASAEAFRDGEDTVAGAGHTLEGVWNYV